MGKHQGGHKSLQRDDKGARATWDERQRQNETKIVWVRVGGGSESEGRRMTTIVGRGEKCRVHGFQKEIVIVCFLDRRGLSEKEGSRRLNGRADE
jgi:hypothetical protein